MEAVRVVHDRALFTKKLNSFIDKLPSYMREVFGVPKFLIHDNDFPVSDQILDSITTRISLPVIVKA